ncbi:MAG: protein kinase, partial [Candidatus Brocadiia bacterium]|nr:protein kinase [Candidatus Brocadiia bacterium]
MTTGLLIRDRYRLGPIIGEGGMGVVHRARDEKLDANVAVKIVRSEEAPHLIRWFLRGARLAQKIDHPYVVRTTDHGRLKDGGAFLVMELVEGIDFDTITASALPLRQKLHL